ncbi:hypothetical protein WAI453_013709 [Rhynchosporium graminicola]
MYAPMFPLEFIYGEYNRLHSSQPTAFHALAGLGPSIGGTFFEFDTDANLTNGTSTGTAPVTTSTSSGIMMNTSGAVRQAGYFGAVYELLIVTGPVSLGAGIFLEPL